jgi:hypothetical protein
MASYLQAGDQEFDLPAKQRTDICTIMYTSGTTGDPKGVLISNASIICLIAGVDLLLNSVNERVRCQKPLHHVILPLHWLTFEFFYVIISAGGNRRLHVLPSSCSYLWPSCGRAVYVPWCIYWILAWGKHHYVYTESLLGFLFWIYIDIKIWYRMLSYWLRILGHWSQLSYVLFHVFLIGYFLVRVYLNHISNQSSIKSRFKGASMCATLKG